LVGKRRYKVATPTPARRAIAAMGTSSPRSANNSRATVSTRARFADASARN
jgi:hypothetical protein